MGGPLKVKRSNLLDLVFLSDGRLAWPVAQAAGMNETTFRDRLKRMSPDDALALPVQSPDLAGAKERQAAAYERWLNRLALMDDGSPAWPVAVANGVCLTTFRKRLARGWSGERAATEPLAQRFRRTPKGRPFGLAGL